MPTNGAQWSSTRAAIREMDAERASQGFLTCKKALSREKRHIEQLMQQHAAAGSNARKLIGINRDIEKRSDHIAELEELLNEYNRRLQVLSSSGSEPDAQAQEPCAPSGASLNYRSPLKRAIALELTKQRNATDLDVCRALDADGAVELPNRLKSTGNRLFASAYRGDQRRKLEITISKVRTDMRRLGLMPRRTR